MGGKEKLICAHPPRVLPIVTASSSEAPTISQILFPFSCWALCFGHFPNGSLHLCWAESAVVRGLASQSDSSVFDSSPALYCVMEARGACIYETDSSSFPHCCRQGRNEPRCVMSLHTARYGAQCVVLPFQMNTTDREREHFHLF